MFSRGNQLGKQGRGMTRRVVWARMQVCSANFPRSSSDFFRVRHGHHALYLVLNPARPLPLLNLLPFPRAPVHRLVPCQAACAFACTVNSTIPTHLVELSALSQPRHPSP